MKTAYRRCLFRPLVGCRVWVSPHGPFSGATAYCTIGSSLWKKLLQPLNDFREHNLDLLSGSHCLYGGFGVSLNKDSSIKLIKFELFMKLGAGLSEVPVA